MTSLNFEKKIFSESSLASAVAHLARPVVMTNGVFDILHRGHVTYLARARLLGASLVVAVNSDASVKQLGKGDDRPVNRDVDRAAVLAALESVTIVTAFSAPTPLHVLDVVRPEIYVKGADYDIDTIPESVLVRTWGGKPVAIPFEHLVSTTGILEQIRGSAR